MLLSYYIIDNKSFNKDILYTVDNRCYINMNIFRKYAVNNVFMYLMKKES